MSNKNYRPGGTPNKRKMHEQGIADALAAQMAHEARPPESHRPITDKEALGMIARCARLLSFIGEICDDAMHFVGKETANHSFRHEVAREADEILADEERPRRARPHGFTRLMALGASAGRLLMQCLQVTNPELFAAAARKKAEMTHALELTQKTATLEGELKDGLRSG